MPLPSMIVYEELKQQGFAKHPKRNGFGELYIGYGHRLLGSDIFTLPKSINKTRCSHKKKISTVSAIDKNREPDRELEKEIIRRNFVLNEEKAKKLLVWDILNHFEVLSARCRAFRRLRNESSFAIIYPKSQLAKYYHEVLCGSEKQDFYVLPRTISSAEAALVRLDVLIYLFHRIGEKRFMAMQNMLENIYVHNFVDASAYMLGHKWGEVLKENAVICAMRMKYGRIIQDAFLENPLKEHKGRYFCG